MNKTKALVAKSYENLPQLTDIYSVNGRNYVKVMTKNGPKQVRAYSEAEYRKYNPEVKIVQPAKSKRDTLGFGEAGYIWIFKGNTYENLEWFKLSPCRYTRVWGWYLPSNIEMPSPLPTDIEPLKLEWADVSLNGQLIAEDDITKVVDKMLYGESTSQFVGNIGDRIDVEVVCTRVTETQSMYGTSYFHIFKAANGNIFTWGTTSKCLEEDKTYRLRGTVKGHQTYKAQNQTTLTRCKVEEVA